MIDMHERSQTGARSVYNTEGKRPKWVTRAIVASGSIACAVGVGVGAVSSAAVHERGAGLPRGGKVVARIVIPENSGVLAVGEGAVWTSSDAVSTLMRLDPKKNAVVGRTKITSHQACPELPGSCGEAAAGNNAVWISRVSDNAVLRIDRATTRLPRPSRSGHSLRGSPPHQALFGWSTKAHRASPASIQRPIGSWPRSESAPHVRAAPITWRSRRVEARSGLASRAKARSSASIRPRMPLRRESACWGNPAHFSRPTSARSGPPAATAPARSCVSIHGRRG